MNNPLLYPIIGQKKARYDIVLAPYRRPGEAPPADEPFKIYDGYGSLTSDMVNGSTWNILKTYSDIEGPGILHSDMAKADTWRILKNADRTESPAQLSTDFINATTWNIYKNINRLEPPAELSTDFIDAETVQVLTRIETDFNDWHVGGLSADMIEAQVYSYNSYEKERQ